MGTDAAAIARAQKAISEIRKGRMVVVTDDEGRENEGDLVMAADKVSATAITFMAREGRGLVCLSLTEERVRQLNLPLMATDNTSPFLTAFTVSIEAAQGVTSGISAADRTHTIKTAIRADARPADLSRPGHVFPLRARSGGVLVRPGHTEVSVDLARLAGLTPAGVICEVMNDDGTMARRPDLERFARKHGLHLLSVADVITYRLAHERLVRRVGETAVTREPWGEFRAYAYSTDVDATVHLALVKGDVAGKAPIITRIHRTTLLGDVMDACTGESSLQQAFRRISVEGRGVIVVLQKHVSAVDALHVRPVSNEQQVPGRAGHTRLQEFGVGAQILQDLGVRRLRLLTNTANTIVGVERYGLEVVEQLPLTNGAGPARRKAGGSPRRSSVG
ncbi:MAG: 3,4-dihydroxy-2-butanone-4-phosphate synthase [Myxococcaceae bacterium]|jgi:3,4-dihydroxy 2-butanone 4-phosphate synthase/GTP cyclohydrolase II|nr:3,4-dihydroxy-2-butanone-4-phosphate synthase [Myxococcaceae bacterium]MCA3013771.1 3,4-dihydroxy-2-butanone-4-phosphate synthase [Myxococcaceae bacterium]